MPRIVGTCDIWVRHTRTLCRGPGSTVDGRNPAPPKKPWNDDSPVNTNKQWFPMVSKWCRVFSIHSITTCSAVVALGSCPRRDLTVVSSRKFFCLIHHGRTTWMQASNCAGTEVEIHTWYHSVDHPCNGSTLDKCWGDRLSAPNKTSSYVPYLDPIYMPRRLIEQGY